jgi:capsule polysaccharide export protein KpsE/RkpR
MRETGLDCDPGNVVKQSADVAPDVAESNERVVPAFMGGKKGTMGGTPQEPETAALARSAAKQEPLIVLARMVWARRYWLAKSTGIGLLIAIVIAFAIPKGYESTIRLMPPEPQSIPGVSMPTALAGVGGALSGAGGLAGALLNSKTSGAIFVGILGSRTVQNELIDRFDLRRRYAVENYSGARRKLAKRTNIEEDRKSGIISIAVTDNDPRRARDLAGAYVDELDKLVSQLSTSSARRERIFLEERLKAVKQDLDAASRELSGFSSRNVTFDMEGQGKAMVDAAAKLQGELIVAESELGGLKSIYADNNVRVRSTEARIAELRRQLQKLGGAGERADDRELKTDQLYPSLRKLPLLGATYYDLYRRVKIQETTYEILTSQCEMAKVQESREIPAVKVLDPPDMPEQKSSPPRALIILLGTLLALIGSIVWIAGRVVWHQTDDAHPAKAVLREIMTSFSGPSAKLADGA